MLRTAWVTDSTAYLDDELKNHPDLFVVPLTIILDNEEFSDGVDLSAEQLFERLKHLKTPPKTSQPSVGTFKQLYEKLAGEYDQIITILLSGKLSGTVSSSVQAAELAGIPVTTIDSKILAYPLTALLKKGMSLIAAGKSMEFVKNALETIRKTNETYVLIGSLEQLHRSGRMSGVQFLLGSMLNVKPIISVEDGELKIMEKARSEKKAKERIIGYLRKSLDENPIHEVYLLYGLHEGMALSWEQELSPEFPEVTFIRCSLGATIGVHAGENTLGISWFKDLNANME